jgi:hypothetical protein
MMHDAIEGPATTAPSGGTAGRVRPLDEGDIPRIAELHRSIFRPRSGLPPTDLTAYLRAILRGHPLRDGGVPSLVWEEAGRVTGCLGVLPRRMTFRGRPILAAISHTFMVEPRSRPSLAGVELGKAFLAGPQDLSLAEGGDLSRRILEGLGGSTALLFSLRWTRPLRPSRYALSFLRRRRLPAALAAALKPLCFTADALGAWTWPLRVRAPRLVAEALHPATVVGALPEMSGSRALLPEYEPETLRWQIELLERKKGHGVLRAVALREASDSVVGWYLYYLRRGGVSEVLQATARPRRFGEVLDHLLHDAWQGGAVAVSGQLDPQELQAYWSRSCVFHHDGASWMLAHARRPEILDAIHRGDAFLSRLDGEWWITP